MPNLIIKDEETNRFIAKKCGWTEHEIGDGGIFGWLPPNGEYKKGWFGSYYTEKELPQYASSLDAMHKAEASLKEETTEWRVYCSCLTKICAPESPICASAAQKAQAFLIASGEIEPQDAKYWDGFWRSQPAQPKL